MKSQSLLRKLALSLTMAAAVVVATGAGAQSAKKQVKISHATAADVGNDNHMMAWIIASYINSNSDTLEARIYPANQLGEERAVIEGMQLGRRCDDAHRRHRDPQQLQQTDGRARPAVHVA